MQTEFTPTLLNELAHQLIHSVHVLNKYGFHQKFAESQRGENLVLGYLNHQEKPITPSEIAEYANLTSARIATILKTLEKKQLITRSCDETDQRRTLVILTAAGKTAATQYHTAALTHIVQMLTQIGPADATEYVRILGKLAENTRNQYLQDKRQAQEKA